MRRSAARVRAQRGAVVGPRGLRLRLDPSDLTVRLLLHRARGEYAEALALWARLRRVSAAAARRLRVYLDS